jgi:hypothetical protein
MKRAIMVVGLALAASACLGPNGVRGQGTLFANAGPVRTRPVPPGGLPPLAFSGPAVLVREAPVRLQPASQQPTTARAQAGKATASAPFVHSVVFYLKKDAPKDAAAKMIADSHTLLAKIPSVKGVWVGRPSKQSTPKVGLTDYQVGLLVLFDNADGLKIYLDHELHTEYVNRHLKHVDRVMVYDFENQKQ